MKKDGSLTLVHICLIVFALILSVVSIVLLFVATDGYDRGERMQYTIFYVINALALISVLVYALKGYGKDVKFFYNAFFCMQIVASIWLFILDITFFKSGAASIIALIVLAIKALALIAITFLADLKNKAWILFYIILGADVIGVILSLISVSSADVAFKVVASITQLVVAAVLGLAIYKKHSDKLKRGRI